MTELNQQWKNIKVESHKNGLKKIILARASVRNAFHAEMIEELKKIFSVLAQIENANEMRLLIIEGEGKVFCAGADLNYMKEQAQNNFEQNLADAKNLGEMFFKLASLPFPVVSAVKGAAIGGGLGLTVCSDYVLCEEKTIFATSEVLLGIVPGVISPYIVRKIGVAQSSFFMLSGQKMNAQEALKNGLINKFTTEENFNLELENITRQFLNAGPLSTRRTKKLIQKYSPLPSSELSEFCVAQIAEARSQEEAIEGLNSFFQKQTPKWCQNL